MKATSEVLSAPVGSGGGPGLASRTKRVTAPGVSAMSSASAASRLRVPAIGAATAASYSPAATATAAPAVDAVSRTSARGSCSRSQRRVCASACG